MEKMEKMLANQYFLLFSLHFQGFFATVIKTTNCVQQGLILSLVFTCLQFKSTENTVGKGEIAQNEQFLLFPQFTTRLDNFCHFHQI